MSTIETIDTIAAIEIILNQDHIERCQFFSYAMLKKNINISLLKLVLKFPLVRPMVHSTIFNLVSQ